MGTCTQSQHHSYSNSNSLQNKKAKDSFELKKLVGVGPESEVWEALHNGKRCAVKALKLSHVTRNYQAFTSQVEAWKQLSHPNIVKCHCFSRQLHSVYLKLDFCAHGSLRDKLKCGPLPTEEIKALSRDVLRALRYLHSRGTVYGKLRPEHVLFDTKQARLSDFSSPPSGYTCMVDLPCYSSPQELSGKSHTSNDIWALGVLLYYSSSGKLPFNGLDHTDVAGQIRDSEPRWDCVPKALRGFIKNLLAKGAVSRPTADEALAHQFLADNLLTQYGA